MPNAPLFVVPVDFAPEMEATVSAAFALAKECGTHVHLLEAVRSPGPSLFDQGASLQSAKQITSSGDWSRLEDSIHAAERRGTKVRVIAYRGDATTVIPSHLHLTKARLLVIGLHYGTSRWRRNASVVTRLSRTVPTPVLILPPRFGLQKRKSLVFGHVVSAVDFTVASAVAVRTAVGLMRRTGARLTLVHALPSAPQQMVFSGAEARGAANRLQAQKTKVAQRLLKRVPAPARLRVDVRVTTGNPPRRILETASRVKADLLVMGVPPRSRLDEMLFGSTLRNVLRRTKIPVLVLSVPAGAHKWSEDTDGVAVAVPVRTTARAKRLVTGSQP